MRENKKGVSGIVVAVIMIALVMAAGVIVWVVIKNTIEQKTSSTESCFGNFDKVKINPLYTCFDDDLNRFNFSISVGDIEVDAIVISIAAGGSTKSYEITNNPRAISDGGEEGLANYTVGVPSGFGTDQIVLPGKNAGKTYVTNFFKSTIDRMEISLIIGGNQCGVAEAMTDIPSCKGII